MRALLRVAVGSFCLLALGGTASAGGKEASGPPARSVQKLKRAYYFTPTKEAPSSREYVYFHGICGRAENGCAALASSSSSAWLLCPRAPVACDSGERWSDAKTAHALLSRAEEELKTQEPSFRATRRGAIGFSQGGYVLQDFVKSRIHAFDRALILGADVRMSASELRAVGIQRIAIGAGRFDGTYVNLEKTARALTAEGYPVKFVDLGRVGHTYVPETGNDALSQAMTWLDEEPES